MNDQLSKTNQHSDDEIDLSELFRTISNGKLTILLFTFLFVVGAFVYAFGKAPIYIADTLLQVEMKKAGIPGLEDLAALSSDDTSVGTELELIKSRKILGEAVNYLKLDIIARPMRIPLLGNLNKRFHSSAELRKLPFFTDSIDAFLNKYAWSHEDISISRLEVPEGLLDRPLIITSIDSDTYSLSIENRVLIGAGKINLSMSSPEGVIINVGFLNALPGTQFKLSKLSNLNAIGRLQKAIKASEKGKKTGIISLKLEGANKQTIVKTLDHISKTYLQQNKSRSAEEASNALKFLEEQIKPVEEKAIAAEANLKKYRISNQTADMSMETQGVLAVVSDIDTELQKLALKRDELIQKYTPSHPVIQSLASQEVQLNSRKEQTLSKISKLPETQQQLLKLERDYQVANTVYLDIVNNIQEFKIAKASTVGNAYIVDDAVVYDEAVKPKKSLILALGALLGGMLGILLVFLQKALHKTVNDPEKLETLTGISVYATIPLTKAVQLTGGFKKSKRQKNLLAKEKPNDPTIESLRSLRTSLHFALLEAKNNIVMITGPSPGIGKSFVSSNFAAVVAASEQRVLLIDADMRKGYLHNVTDQKVEPGLSDLISEKATLEEVIHRVQLNDNTMDIITRGHTPPNPSELLMHSNFEKVLSELSSRYDLVIIDTPPVHAVTDPMIIGKHSGVSFMVVRSNQHSMKEIEHAVTRLAQNGVDTKGFIFNGFVQKKGTNGYGGYGYQSYYGDYQSDK